jgi:hypothetical protein
MLLGRVLIAPSALVLLVLVQCSDPPTEPARAAAYITVSPGSGSCSASHGELTWPASESRAVEQLDCSLEQKSCNPGEYETVDGDTDASVICSVTPNGDKFTVNLNVSRTGSSLSFSGSLDKTGGSLQLQHYSNVTSTTVTGACNIVIEANKSTVKAGAIWAHFDCPAIRDPGAAGGSDCAAAGAFIFEKCGGS